MRPNPEQVFAVEEWMRASFPETYVASEGDFDREVYLFRARESKRGGNRYEIEISYEAFEDHAAGKIVTMLNGINAAERLEAEPNRRFFLDRFFNFGRSKDNRDG